jgi:thiol-disulfide isomerase/thioredoxin/dienelactone hydrolase
LKKMKRVLSAVLLSSAALAFSGGGASASEAAAGQKAAAAKPAPPPAPAVKVSEIKEAGLKALREESAAGGRVLLVNFWATWCTPCREEFPDLIKLRERYATDKFDLVFVSLDDVSEIATTVPEFLAQMKIGASPSYLLNPEDADAAINLFDPEWRGELPATFVYDPSGALVYKHRGRIKPAEVQKAIDGALGPKPAPAPARKQPQNPTEGRERSPAAEDMSLQKLLAYDEAAPLGLKVVGAERRDGVTIEDVTFRGEGETIQAYVVRPADGAGPFAGVLFVHWFAPPDPTSNRTQYLEEASALARRGAVSLLVSTFWSDPARYKARRWETDFENSVAQAKSLRRALDLLVSRPGVDASRVAYVGHDYGAMFGALVSAVDARPKAYALIAGASRFADWYLFGSSSGVPTGAALERYREQLSVLDPVSVVGRAKASFFFQFGERDKYTPRDNFIAFYSAAPDPKRLATYISDHDMSADLIRRDRTAWLAEQLALPAER